MFDILFIPYRDLYFWRSYGSAVRDLQFLEVLTDSEFVSSITVLNRPVSIYERVSNKIKRTFNYNDVNVIDVTSFDLFGPLKKRAWTVGCYSEQTDTFVSDYCKQGKNTLLVIDFTPFAIFPLIQSNKVIYWYDMIDNFTKHNCFSDHEKMLVDKKYQYVAKKYQFMSAVSDAAANAITKYRDFPFDVVPNGVFNSKFSEGGLCNKTMEFDFGFVGFITDKFDVDFVCSLASKYSIVVYGEVYDKRVSDKLSANGVHVKGRFSYNELPRLISSFKIGLLPYLIEKSHDGSPLKLYEYFKNNTPCITSINYEYTSRFIVNYNESKDLDSDIRYLEKISGDKSISDSIPAEMYLSVRLNNTIEILMNEGEFA